MNIKGLFIDNLLTGITELRPLSLYSTLIYPPNDDNNKIGLVTLTFSYRNFSVHFLLPATDLFTFYLGELWRFDFIFLKVSKSLEFITF